ncbi:MAG: acyl-CoA reductase, partial [Bacteroidota bacterium]
DAVMWDQNACSSPQLLYLEGEEKNAKDFIPLLAEAFRNAAKELPIGELSNDELVEITKVREMAKVERIRGIAEATFDRGTVDWTVLYKKDPAFETSPLNRTLLVKRVDDLNEIGKILAPYLFYLQSVGIELPHGRLEEIADRLSGLGLTRLTAVGRMSSGKNGAPHDGGYPLREMIRWASLEREFSGYVDLDYLPEESRKKILDAKLEALVHFVRERSSFYREFWGEKKTFEELPILDRKTLAPHLPPDSTEALTGPLTGTYLFSSGGTMGKPRVFTFTPQELRDSTDVFGRGFRMAGIEREDVVANLFMPGYLWSSFIVTNQALETIGCTILPIGVTTEREKVAQLLLDLHATCLVGIPTQLLNVARAFEAMGIVPGIRKIGYAGEHLSQGSRDYLRRVLGAEKIFSVGYAAVDVGPIAYACDCAEGTVHHVASDYCFVELLDPTTHQPVQDGEVGEIVVTNLSRTLTPIVRYALGDLGRKIGGRCACGRTAERFELLGRSDDVLIVGGANYSTGNVESLIEEDSRFNQNYQMVATNPNHRETLTFRLELSKVVPEAEKTAIAAELVKKAREDKALSYDLDAGLIDFQIELVEPGGLPSVARTQKTKRTLDLRT